MTTELSALVHMVCAAEKLHAREREIVSDAAHPAKTDLRAVARATHLTKWLSQEFTWTPWNQSHLPLV